MSCAVSRTRPSVGSSSVAARLSLRSASVSGAALPWPGTSERSCAWTWAVISTSGDCWSAAHSTRSISAPYLGSFTRSVTLALPRPGDVARTLPVGRLEGRQRDPRLGGAGGRLDAHGQRVGAPALWHGRVGCLRRGKTRCEAEALAATPAFRMSRRFIWFFPQWLWSCQGGQAPRRRECPSHPGPIRIARDSGLYRMAEGLQGGAAAVNSCRTAGLRARS